MGNASNLELIESFKTSLESVQEILVKMGVLGSDNKIWHEINKVIRQESLDITPVEAINFMEELVNRNGMECLKRVTLREVILISIEYYNRVGVYNEKDGV